MAAFLDVTILGSPLYAQASHAQASRDQAIRGQLAGRNHRGPYTCGSFGRIPAQMTRARWTLLTAALVVNALLGVALLLRVSYAPMPGPGSLANPGSAPLEGAYDVLGETVSAKDANEILATEATRRQLSPKAGAVPLTRRLVEDGREVFYKETFGSEYFLTDVLGLWDGGITAQGMWRALLALAGRGTNDLRVRLDKDVRVGQHLFREGTMVSTGLDVPRGGWLPLGLRFFYDRGRVRAGVTCALCHATVDRDSGLVVEGAPNTNLNVGLMLALASNSAAYYLHTSVPTLEPYLGEHSPSVKSAEGVYMQLPEPEAFEVAISGMLAQWPPGTFDSTIDRVNNPTSIPDSFTAHAHPFGWTGYASIGPFRGLSAMSNHAHALNLDETALAASLPLLHGTDPEVHLAILLQRAENPKFRFDPVAERRPSEVLESASPGGRSPGLNRYAALPSYPRPNFFTVNSLIAVREGEPVGYALNALSAFQNSLRPPDRFALNVAGVERGERIFQAAGCGRCHSGPGFTNHEVIAAAEIGTEPSRARALSATEDVVVAPVLFALDTRYPPPPDAMILTIPLDADQRRLLRLGWAHGTDGGYKVTGLVGLEWSAPYLHDGGVAVGRDPSQQLGIPGTFGRGIVPDPRNSLRALFDRALRQRVLAVNSSSPALVAAHVTGQGHTHWVDLPSGFSALDQEALLDYLLSLRGEAAR